MAWIRAGRPDRLGYERDRWLKTHPDNDEIDEQEFRVNITGGGNYKPRRFPDPIDIDAVNGLTRDVNESTL
jgi:hypothetical protein